MRLTILVALAAFAAAPSVAEPRRLDVELWQDQPAGQPPTACPNRNPDGTLIKAKKEFVDNYQAAQRALDNEDWTGALGAAALAGPHARDGQQTSALLQIEIAAYAELGDRTAEVEKINIALASPCLAPALAKNYQQILKRIEDEAAASQQH